MNHSSRRRFVGAHPDDPETGYGGTLAAHAERGHRTTVIYLTRGERGIPGKSLEEAAAVRTKVMEVFRGREAGVAAAEAFSVLGRNRLPTAD